ncbi:MAG: acetolactate synthase large subunit [Candidatus Uhrbacteria bacterium]|nr:acetolactate synthase large subunit [Candidatus Uhrbacteria bacterium]
MHAAELFVKSLEQEGVKYVFGVPGEENLRFLEALRTSSIQFVPTRHEQSAGFIAATIGRLTGKTGVALSTLGPGATNFMTAAAYAQLGGMPMLMITGQKPIRKSKQGAFQIIDVVNMMRPVTKFTKQLIDGEAVAATVREAFREAEEERPGAVHIELPEDVADDLVESQPLEVKKIRRPIAEEKAISQAVELIQNAKSPLLLIGAGANRKLTAKMLREFIDKTGIPFFDTQMGKGVVDERHELYVGTAALSANDYVHCAVEAADLIINVGHDVVEKPPFIMKRNGQTVIHINFYSAKMDQIYFPQQEVIGDIANAIWQIKERITPSSHWDFSKFLHARNQLLSYISSSSIDQSFPIKPQTLVATVRETLPSDGIACLDNGMYKLWFARQYQAHEPNTLLLDNALATMGAGLPSAIAAAMLFPEKKILAICGDGGFMMNSQEMETAVRLRLNITILLLDDNGYGMIKWKQTGMQLPTFGLEFKNPDFVKYAESYGAFGHELEKTEDLKALMKKTFAVPGIHLIHIPVDYSENDKVLSKDLKKRICS